MLSDDLRDELAAIAPARECDRLAELSGLFHVAGRAHLRGRGSVDVHRDVASSTVARRAFALLRALDVTSEIRTTAGLRSTTRRGTSSMSKDRPRRTRRSIGRAFLTAPIARSTGRRAASSRGAAA